jgi:hypothetical protein
VSVAVAVGFIVLGSACVVIGVHEWRNRAGSIAESDALFGQGRWGHVSNSIRIHGGAVGFALAGLAIVIVGVRGLF